MPSEAAGPVKTIALRACPSCRATGSIGVALDEHPLRRCTTCDLVYAAEYADPDDIYKDGYLMGGGTFGPPNVLDPVFHRFLLDAGRQRMAVIEKAIGGPGAMLDVGCGAGEVLLAAKERGWRTAGADPVEDSVTLARSRGLDVHAALLQDTGLPERSFDLVSAFHVVEHLTDSTAFLELIARWARPGGHVLVELPNWASVHRRRTGAQWPSLRPLEHLGHYSPDTLDATLRRAGLEPVLLRTMGFLWEGQTLDQALADLARQGWAPWFRRSRLLVHERDDHRLEPSAAGWRVLRAVQAAYDRRRAGQVVFAIARVP
ncbi:hypothetical protein BH20ACT2_BH20ACT2_20590 [soil metagenome]